MNSRERNLAVLRYEEYDRLPIVHFGWWPETLEKWAQEGHLTKEEIDGHDDGNNKDKAIGRKLGFDYNYFTMFYLKSGFSPLFPAFERIVVEELDNSARHVRNEDGVIVLEVPGAGSIPTEIGHTLEDRQSWEKYYLPRLQWHKDRVDLKKLQHVIDTHESRETPLGLFCGSLFGQMRNWMGVTGVCYLYVDDEPLYDEIIKTVAELSYQSIKFILEAGARFDFAHFWEDIAFKNGPLVVPSVFKEKVGPYYKMISGLCRQFGMDIISVDCDGVPTELIHTWLDAGVNTMFPIEYGTWHGNISDWRKQFGRELRGVGGMNKNVFAMDYAAIDKEIERLRPMVDLGGYIPCPDHRVPPDAIWENVQYYTDKMREVFGG